MPRATEHIKEQLKLIEVLDENGYTYQTEDGIYDVSKQELWRIIRPVIS